MCRSPFPYLPAPLVIFFFYAVHNIPQLSTHLALHGTELVKVRVVPFPDGVVIDKVDVAVHGQGPGADLYVEVWTCEEDGLNQHKSRVKL